MAKATKASEVENKADSKKSQDLEKALNSIRKQFGQESISVFGDQPREGIKACSSGSLSLDLKLGIGGYPYGRIVEIYGPESSGKTTLALHAMASAQNEGKTAAFIDAEHALDPEYAKSLGVKMNEVLLSQPSCGEEALEILDMLIESAAVEIIVVDSVAALTPRAEIEGNMGDSTMGVQARLMSQALRKITAKAQQNKVLVIFINQLRDKIGVMFGSPETTTGGKALKFYASQRLDIRRIETIKGGPDNAAIANRVRVKVVKNKVAPPFTQAEFQIDYGKGVNRNMELLDLAETNQIIKKAGAWYSYEGDQLGQGKDKTLVFLADNPELMAEIEAKLMAKIKPVIVEEDAATEEETAS